MSGGKYAEGTSVSTDRSRAEIEGICRKYGADQFVSGWDGFSAKVAFKMKGRFVRIELPIMVYGKSKTKRGITMGRDHCDSENRRRWRCLVLYVKAKLESVASEIVTFEEAFLAHIVMPSGQTVGAHCVGQISTAYESGRDVPLLGGKV